MIILLDLNFTLVENSDQKLRPFQKQIEAERYRGWLVELVKPHHVILMTARPALHASATLASIKAKTGWQPQESYFNRYGLAPAQAKERMLLEHVLPRHGNNGHGKASYLAIESNPRTHSMYDRYSIRSVKVEPGDMWHKLPE